jgi:hypothetical protein
MSGADIIFVAWWSGVGLALGLATWAAIRRGEEIDWESVVTLLLVGIAAALALYVLPGSDGSYSAGEIKLRLLGSLALAWVAMAMVMRPSPSGAGRSAMALAAFIGVNAPPLALLLSATMVCGGHPSCL